MKEISKTLAYLGFDPDFANKALEYSGLLPARVSQQHRELYKVLSENGEFTARVSGKFAYQAIENGDFPAVGDWVMIEKNQGANEALIHHILPRKSAFERSVAGKSKQRQIIAANIDVVFICMSLNRDFNLRRLERYLTVAYSSGAVPVIVLTKTDLCEDIPLYKNKVQNIAPAADILLCSAFKENECDELLNYLKPGKTYAFIGSSGAGKSTLINLISGEKRFEVNGLRNDDKGRHTTTHRELILLNNGVVVIDNPGMRELQPETADISRSFEDIEELAMQCKFSNCTHTTEPNCAVTAAIKDGILDEKRFENYLKLQREISYHDANPRMREQMKINAMFDSKKQMKQKMDAAKNKHK